MPYDPSLADNVSLLRFRVGDTNDDAPLLPDATYLALLASNGQRMDKAELAIVQALIVKYAQQPDTVTIPTIGTTVSWRDRLNDWRRQAARLTAEIAAAAGGLGGLRTRQVSRFDRSRATGEYYAKDRPPWDC